MKFYNRESEIAQLEKIREKSLTNAQFTVVTGRRRIGKTQLLIEATKNDKVLYFFVARKSETLLCEDFIKEIKRKLNVPVLGKVTSFSELFAFLIEISKTTPFSLIIDEFQDFYKINEAVYSDIQKIWDLHHNDIKINLLVCGSIYSLMNKIFKDAKEPLFGRATNFIKVRPFSTKTLQIILSDFNQDYTTEDLLTLYTFTGGVAKYVQLFMDNGAITHQVMVQNLLKEDAVFLSEGKNILIGEFGKEYAVYFSVLAAIAQGKTKRNDIEQLLQREVGGYLTRLENDYGLISKKQPILTKSRTKNFKYEIVDNFLMFWFRFIFKYQHIIEIGNYKVLHEIVVRDYKTFSGFQLEKYYKAQLMASQNYTRIGSYWDRKGENEIDIIAINDLEMVVNFYEIKRQKNNIRLETLKEKANYFLSNHPHLKDFKKKYVAYSMDDM
jgi:AAA+ ATPase superfamily predicted ATPase